MALQYYNQPQIAVEEQKAEFELSFGIAERISEVLKAKKLTQKDFTQKLHKRESEISKKEGQGTENVRRYEDHNT